MSEDFLEELGQGQGYLKSGLLGFPKSGKTFTAVEIAIGLYKYFGNCERIVFYDSEGGSEYVAKRIRAETGKALIGKKSRSFHDLMSTASALRANDILIVDSITHPWRELCESHLNSVNEKLEKWNKPKRHKLEFQDWGVIKPIWEQWTIYYLNSPVHIIICGRAGWEYEMETNEETNKKELIKTGTKMKTESEFGFEPSLLIEMERVDLPAPEKGLRGRMTERRATVRGDRFNVIDGETFVNPTFKDFLPHIEQLKAGANFTIDGSLKTNTGIGEDGEAEANKERKTRTILAEEIQGLITYHIPGQSASDKQAKAGLLFDCFGTRSWTAVESMKSRQLRDGIEKLKARLEHAENGIPAVTTGEAA